MDMLEITQNDKLYYISFPVKNHNNVAEDLTDVTTAKFKMALPGTATSKIVGTCDIPEPTSGECKYLIQPGDTDTVGIYHAEIELTYSGGKVITTRMFGIKIVKELPDST